MKLSVDRIAQQEYKIKVWQKGRVIIQQDFDNLEAELQKAHARIAKLQRKQMGNNNKIALARFRIANLNKFIEEDPSLHQAATSVKLVARHANITTVSRSTTLNIANIDNTTPDQENLMLARQSSYKELHEAANPNHFKSHLTKDCRNKGPATGSNLLAVTVTCHACGEKEHYANQCRKTTTNNAQGRAYMLRDRNAHQNP
ncbi:hypothetical protein Tco_1202782, partial [Tanacetum coccineum]